MTAVKEEPTLIKSQASRRRGHWREPNFPMSFLENKESCPCLQMDPLDVVSLWHVFDPSPLSNLSLRDLMDSACPQRAPRGHFSFGGVVRGGYFASVLVCFPENPGTSGKFWGKRLGNRAGNRPPTRKLRHAPGSSNDQKLSFRIRQEDCEGMLQEARNRTSGGLDRESSYICQRSCLFRSLF